MLHESTKNMRKELDLIKDEIVPIDSISRSKLIQKVSGRDTNTLGQITLNNKNNKVKF